MRFLANENMPLASVYRLREAGHDVRAIHVESPGVSDVEVLDSCHHEGRILLTFDRDYGELIFHRGLPIPAGVIYLRFDPASPEEPAEVILLSLLVSELTFEGQFTVVQRDHIRQRALPS